MKVINPATEDTLLELEEDTADTLAAKFQLLQSGQFDWSRKPIFERVDTIKRFITLLESERAILAATLTAETGKPLWQAKNEIKGAVGRVAWLADHAVTYLSDETMAADDGRQEIIRYEPLGVVGNISAWNYPYLVGVNVIVPALLAGNAVLYKPSEYAVQTGLHIERLLKRAGIPEDCFQVAIGSGAVGKALLSMDLDGYFFTGSHATGKFIYEQVAPKMVPCQLELGGKDPIYITANVDDIAAVAAATADGAFYNNGQSCCSVERIYVHERVYDGYIEAFIKQVAAWKIGDPTDDNVYFGPLTRPSQIQVLEAQVADAVSQGAKVLTGGRRLERKGYYFEPTVLVDVNHQMAVMREESFGPVIGIMKVANDDEALALMQDTTYGLTAGVYTQDKAQAMKLLGQLDVGSAYWNCCDRVSPALPWSGRRHSGIGATLSHQGIRAFTKPKAWHLHS